MIARLLAPVVLRAVMLALMLASPLGLVSSVARAQEPRGDVLRWGADPSGGAPFAFFDPDNPDRVIGFEVDIMAEVARRLGRSTTRSRRVVAMSS